MKVAFPFSVKHHGRRYAPGEEITVSDNAELDSLMHDGAIPFEQYHPFKPFPGDMMKHYIIQNGRRVKAE